MKKFFSFLIKQTVAILLAVVFVTAFGVYATFNMPVNLLPDINVPMICVQAIYPGANAQSVEKDVTVTLEEGLASVPGITDVVSYSYDNLSALLLSFDYGTDTAEKKSVLNAKLSALNLPDGVTTSIYDIDLNAEALAVLSVTGQSGASEAERLAAAYAAAREIADKIQAIDGVEKVEIKGGAETSYVIRPYGGLELVSPLLVQAFSYGGLDIPIGNISENGSNIQIRNNSDVTSEADIQDMPLTLPQSVGSLLGAVRQLMGYYEDSTADDLVDLRTDIGTGVIEVLRELDGYTSTQIDDFALLKTYMNIAGNYTASQLRSFRSSRYYKNIYEAVTDPVEGTDERTPKTDEEIDEIVEDIRSQYPAFSQYITSDMLRVVSRGELDTLITYREDYVEKKIDYTSDEFYELTDDDFYVLETQYVHVYGELYDENSPEKIPETVKSELYNNIQFAGKVSGTGLAAIADKKAEEEEKEGEGAAYSPTDSECALLFSGTQLSQDHPILMSPTFISFIRSEAYESNMQSLIDMRASFGEELTAAEFWAVYQTLDLSGVFEFKLSEKLFGFLVDKEESAFSDGGVLVKVREIADVEKSDSYSSYVYFSDGKAMIAKGTIVEVYKSNGANSSAVVKKIKAAYTQFLSEEGVSYGAQVTLLDDQSQFISDSIGNVLVSMLIGGALAIVIIFLFLKKVRASLIVAVTMPLSVLAALICLSLTGITLNMVSLGGLAVGIGMLVDNSIVVIESISKHREAGKKPFAAAVDGVCEVGGALFGSTLTTVCVFVPIIFSGGLTGEIFTDLGFAVTYSLAFSLIVSVSVIPALYVLLNEKGGGHVRKQKGKREKEKPVRKYLEAWKEPRIMNKTVSLYGKLLPKVLGRRTVTLILAVCIFGGSIGMLFITGTEFLPSIDQGQLEVSMSYNPGVEIGQIQEDVFAFATKIQDETENVDYVSVSVGKNGILALTDTGIIKVRLTTNRHTGKTVERIRSLAEGYKKENGILRSVSVREIDGVLASLMSGENEMSVTVRGSDANTLREIAAEIKTELERPENGFKEVHTSASDLSTQYTLRFDRNRMAELGLDYQTTVMTLRIGIASYDACTVTIDGEEYTVNVGFEGGAVTTREELENFVVGAETDDGVKAVKLKDVLKTVYDGEGNPVKVLVEEQESCIRRNNGKEMISVSAVLPGVDTGTAGKKMQKIAAAVIDRYEGYSFEESGITGYLNDAFDGLVVALIVSFFLLYAVMAVQFGSWVTPLIVMSSIPFSFTGGFLALVLTGTKLSVVSFIGLIMLMGVVVNNAIVMLEKIKQLHEGGMPHFDAVQEACKVRLRPILMTTLTTVLALIPMAIGIGQGSELMQPLGIVVVGGLFVGTLVTLVVVPTVYCAVYRLSAKHPEGKGRGHVRNETPFEPIEGVKKEAE